MKRILLTLLLCTGAATADDAELLVQFGLGDKEPTVWDGSVTVTPGEVAEVSGYRFEQKDMVQGPNGWKAATRTPQGAVKPPRQQSQKAGRGAPDGPHL